MAQVAGAGSAERSEDGMGGGLLRATALLTGVQSVIQALDGRGSATGHHVSGGVGARWLASTDDQVRRG